MHLLRGALAALIVREPDMEVVAEPRSSREVVPAALMTRPHVTVLDIDFWEQEWLDILRDLHEQLPECAALILTSSVKPAILRHALATQVHGCIVKSSPPTGLAEGIRRVARGERVIDLKLAVAALQATESPLTQRELDVLRIAAEGAPAPEIAARLCLSAGTVRNYLSGAIRKTGARNRVDAIRIADDAGWLHTVGAEPIFRLARGCAGG